MWLRIDADMPWHDKIVGLPTDTARFAFVKVLCAAKVRGKSVFSRGALKEALGSHARALPALVAAGLLDEDEDGNRLTVHDFDDYQRKAGHAEAQDRYRQRVTAGSPNGHEPITERSPTGHTVHTGQNGTPQTPFDKRSLTGSRSRGHSGQHKDCTVCDAARSAGSIDEQMDDQWRKCKRCGQRKGGPAHAPGADHEFAAA